MNTVASVQEIWMQVRLLFRHKIAVAGVIVLPSLLLLLLHSLYAEITVPLALLQAGGLPAGEALPESSTRLAFAWYLTPTLASFGLATACYATLGLRLAVAREMGVLKQARISPVAPSTYLGGWIGAGVAAGLIVAAVTGLTGWLAYRVAPPIAAVPTLIMVVGAASACFCALGIATASLVRDARSAPPVVLAVLLPLAVLSNVFFIPGQAPAWFDTIGGLLPLEPARAAMTDAFNGGTNPVSSLGDLVTIVAWLLVAIVVSIRTFSWLPRH